LDLAFYLQKHVRIITFITELNIVKHKCIKLKEKTDRRVGLFLFTACFYMILGLYSYLSDNQQKG